MQLQTYHRHIQDAITAELRHARQQIRIAVAWFTNKELMSELLESLHQGCKVELIILNDKINFRTRGIDYQKFVDLGGKVYISHQGPKLHHKCS